ncbi:HAD family hydrolase [Paratractidigestivibacter faecalis]|uniref:HAD family phosphatase n=1 Tax=Paratractidigestivibacter faecalis TaxID=2292441 RepID=A0ABV1IGI2_9ACTN
MATRKNVVFDMGNVLMTFDGHEFSQAFTSSEEDAQALYEGVFGRVEWSLLDSGTIDHQTMLRVALAHTPERLHACVRECLARWPEHSRVIEPTNDLALRLHEAGWGVYVLSNASDRIEEQLSRTPVFGFLDGIVVSGRERLMKPGTAIFQLLCSRYGLDPATCVFVDDNADNCEGARAAGMDAFRYTGDIAELEAFLGGLG